MQVALTVNINGRSRTLNNLAGATVNDRPHSSVYVWTMTRIGVGCL